MTASAAVSNTILVLQVPVERSRFLRLMAAAIFGLAVKAASPHAASAGHGTIQYPCFGAGPCHCCNGRYCCESWCSWHSNFDHPGHGCPSSNYQCWYAVDEFACKLYECCDWHAASVGDWEICICRRFIQNGPC